MQCWRATRPPLRRPLDAHQTFFAMGEAIAHLHYLYYAGRLKTANGADGIMR